MSRIGFHEEGEAVEKREGHASQARHDEDADSLQERASKSRVSLGFEPNKSGSHLPSDAVLIRFGNVGGKKKDKTIAE